MKKWEQFLKKITFFLKNTKSNLSKVLSNLLILGVYFSYSISLYAVKFIDVDECEVRGKKGLRIVLYDTDAQKFLQIKYHFITRPPEQNTDLLKDGLLSLRLLKNNRVEALAPSLQDYAFRVTGDFKYKNDIIPKDPATSKTLFQGAALPVISVEGIIEQLHAFNTKASGDPFSITAVHFIDTTVSPWSFADVGNNERGRLGELATELTMTQFGYIKIHSQTDRGSNGFDGVFYRGAPGSADRALFLTESKCRNEDISAETYMEYGLNERTIFKRLEATKYHSSANLIDDFIINIPENIFKFVQRIKADGVSEFCIQKFNVHEFRLVYQRELSPSSSEEMKKMAVTHLMDRLKISPEDMISIVQTTSTSQAEIRKMGLKREHNPPPIPLQEYSMANLLKLVKLIRNQDNSLNHVPVDKHVILDLIQTAGLGLEVSMGPIDKLFGFSKIPLGDFVGERIWYVLTHNFDEVCTNFELDKNGILEAFSN